MVALAPMEFKSLSQAGQDMAVAHILDNKREGFFLEIGSNNPVEINNTYALEKFLDWRGLGVDNSAESMLAFEEHRLSPFYFTDAAKPQNWLAAIKQMYEMVGRRMEHALILDYLSLDVDEASLACLSNLPLPDLRFRVMTIEHDEYRRPGTRDAMLDILRHHKYDVLCADVCDQGLPFEIWAVDPLLVDMTKAERFRRDKPTEWREFFK